MGQAIRIRVDLPVAEFLALEQQCRRIRSPLGLQLKQFMNARLRIGTIGPVPFLYDSLPFLGAHQRYPRQWQVRIPDHGTHQNPEVTEHPANRLLVKQVGVVFELPDKLLGLEYFDRQIELRDSGLESQFLHGQPGNLKYLLGHVLECEQHLEQWTGIYQTLRNQLFHQLLKGKVLVHVGFESRGAHLTNQIAEAEVFAKVSPEHQGIHEQPNHIFNFQFVAGCNRRAHQNALLHGVAPQQRLKCGQGNHEQRPAFVLRQGLQFCQNAAVKSQLFIGPVPTVARWTGAIRG